MKRFLDETLLPALIGLAIVVGMVDIIPRLLHLLP